MKKINARSVLVYVDPDRLTIAGYAAGRKVRP